MPVCLFPLCILAITLFFSQNMALRFDWSKLDDASAEALRDLLNQHLASSLGIECSSANDAGTPTSKGSCKEKAKGAVDGLEKVEVTSFRWGTVPPFVELLEIGPAIVLPPTPDNSSHSGSGHAVSGMPQCTSPEPSPSLKNSVQLSADTHTPSDAERDDGGDSLAAYFGPSGLLLRVHLTYGGNLGLTVRCTASKQVHFSATCSAAFSLPMQFDATNVRIDCILNFNLHRNRALVWLQPSAVSDSALQDIQLTATLGGASSSPCVDDTTVGAFLLSEVQSFLKHKLTTPHYISIPVTL